MLSGTKRLTNEAHLWYVPMCVNDVDKVMPVPPMSYASAEMEEKGRSRRQYQKQKEEREKQTEVETPPLHVAETG